MRVLSNQLRCYILGKMTPVLQITDAGVAGVLGGQTGPSKWVQWIAVVDVDTTVAAKKKRILLARDILWFRSRQAKKQRRGVRK